jgi:RNA polymerase-interacting CarD/CdnL/TRCF family regulator
MLIKNTFGDFVVDVEKMYQDKSAVSLKNKRDVNLWLDRGSVLNLAHVLLDLYKQVWDKDEDAAHKEATDAK